MSQFDDVIRRSLSQEDLRPYDALSREQNPIQEAMLAFRTQHWALAVGGWLAGFALFGASLYSIARFLQAGEVRSMLIWFGLAGLAALGLVLVKLWFWLEMQKNAVIREVKRLELQVAALLTAKG